MESIEWKAQRYDQLLEIAGEQLAAKVEGYDRLAVEAAALKWKAERYDELMEIAGERALSRLRGYDALLGQMNEFRAKAGEYKKLLRLNASQFETRIADFEGNLLHRLGRLEALEARLAAAEWKAGRYNEIVRLGGERTIAKLKTYDELTAAKTAWAWKMRRYDALIELGGERAAAKLRVHDRLVAESKELRAQARRAMQALARAGGGEAEAEAPPYSVVLVLGAARTGTTMIGSFLAWAPESHALPQEAAPLFNALRSHSNMLGASARFMGDENKLAADAAIQTYLRLFFDAYHAQQKTPTLVFRSPALTRYFGHLVDLIDFAPARFICCVRDPRDACASLLDWHARAIANGRRPILDDDRPATAAEFFMGYYNNVLSTKDAVDPTKLTFVRYEDAVAIPRTVTARLGAFAGVDLSDFDPTAPWPEASHDFQAEKEANLAVTPLYGQAPSKAQIGRYRERFTPEEIAEIETICRPVIRAFGYGSSLADVSP